MGQISLFGTHTGITEDITLPQITSEVGRREILNWERDLIGLYVSDHPLNPVMDILTENITHFSGQLAEAENKEKVRVAGLVTRIRPHLTKKGQSMGFATIEDLQGNIDLVIFPSVWDQYSDVIDFDTIILVDGKADTKDAEPKVLVDKITTELKTVTSIDSPTNLNEEFSPLNDNKNEHQVGERPFAVEDFSENITEIYRIRFYIEDKAIPSNYNYSQWHDFQVDDEKPRSWIIDI
jgi:DNA polymerase III alpha subunit